MQMKNSPLSIFSAVFLVVVLSGCAPFQTKEVTKERENGYGKLDQLRSGMKLDDVYRLLGQPRGITLVIDSSHIPPEQVYRVVYPFATIITAGIARAEEEIATGGSTRVRTWFRCVSYSFGLCGIADSATAEAEMAANAARQ